MTMVKEPSCETQAVIDLVTRTVDEAKAVMDVGAELSFILPSQSAHQFPQLFDTLDGELNVFDQYIPLSAPHTDVNVPQSLIAFHFQQPSQSWVSVALECR